MEPYNQRREDPSGFYGGVALIAALFAAGALYTGGAAGPIGLLAAAVAVGCWWRARR